jgi:hypothetical protein
MGNEPAARPDSAEENLAHSDTNASRRQHDDGRGTPAPTVPAQGRPEGRDIPPTDGGRDDTEAPKSPWMGGG